MSVNKVLDVSDTETDEVSGSNLSKSALKKLKLSQLKQIATGKHITIDDAMTKNAIIDILTAN